MSLWLPFLCTCQPLTTPSASASNLNLLPSSFYVIPRWWSASLPCFVFPGPPKEQPCKWIWHCSPPTKPSTYCSADSPAPYIHTPHPPYRASHSDTQSLHTLATYTTSQYTRSRERQRFVWPRRNLRLIGLAAGPLLCWRRSRGWWGFLWEGQRRRGGERGHRVAQRRFWRWLLGHWGGIERWLGRWWGEWGGRGEAGMKFLVGWLGWERWADEENTWVNRIVRTAWQLEAEEGSFAFRIEGLSKRLVPKE